jgi:hypothetical protein
MSGIDLCRLDELAWSEYLQTAARALCNGKTLAFQAKDAGSIPAARSSPFHSVQEDVHGGHFRLSPLFQRLARGRLPFGKVLRGAEQDRRNGIRASYHPGKNRKVTCR